MSKSNGNNGVETLVDEQSNFPLLGGVGCVKKFNLGFLNRELQKM